MEKIRNIAIIAHVDHGKTTLVDKMLVAGKLFKDHETPGDLIMDSNDLERERGITILAKNVSVRYKDYKINIIDTPGHADFGGEVERVLNMADGVVLLVDAFEGPMPQTRFVSQKALQLGLKPIVVVNKVDKPNCTPDEAAEAVFELMMTLDATDDQLDFPVVYGSAKNGWMSKDWKQPTDNIFELFETIIDKIPAPKVEQGTPQLMITSLDHSTYIGRFAIGRLQRGELKANQMVSLVKRDGKISKQRIKDLFLFEGFEKKKVEKRSGGRYLCNCWL
jgi:GTP-binding protein